MKKPGLAKAWAAAAIGFALPLLAPAQTPPEKFLGFKVGADRRLADYAQITAYFQKLDQESSRLELVTIGESTLKKPMIMAVITSERNMSRLDALKDIARRLRDAPSLGPEEARRLAREGKAILLITCNIHASEIAAAQMSMELAHKLVTGDTPFDSARVLEDVIVLLVPTTNPDGEQLVVDWYNKYVGTPYEGGPMPWLYHPYAGHDNNRDWFMFNLPETRAVSRVLYQDWLPQIHIDEHQMGSTGARLFVPPFMDPPVPTVQPLLWRSISLCGANMAYDLQKNGFKGVEQGRSYTGWYIGACDDTSWLHNVVGLLSEAASVRMATPVRVEPNEIPQPYYERRMEFIDPWPGGWWRLRDIVDYELTLSFSLIRTAYINKEDFLFNFYQMYRNSVERTEKDQPYAYVIPPTQHDYPAALEMVKILMLGGVEVEQAKEQFIAGGRIYPAGSFVVRLGQPYKPYAWSLLGRQKYPDLRQYPGGPPTPPYDNAGWTLPLQMGVTCDEVAAPFEAVLNKLAAAPAVEPVQPTLEGDSLILDCRSNAAYGAVFALLKAGAEVRRSREEPAGIKCATGSFVIKNTPEVQKALPDILKKWPVRPQEFPSDLADVSSFASRPVPLPRIGLYQSWRAGMDEGWTRYVLDSLGVPYVTLHNDAFRPAKDKKDKKVDLRANHDVIVFADESADIIKTGKPSPTSERARFFTANYPPEYEGGIGTEGVEALKAFVEAGGIVVLLNGACELGMKDLGAPARDVLERVERTKFFCPTSILRVTVDNRTPIGYGMPETAAAVFSDSPALSTWIPPADWDRQVVASYPDGNVLLSGWLLGEDMIARRAAVVDTRHKKGRLILIGIPCQSRAQSHGTYKFLLNALLYPPS